MRIAAFGAEQLKLCQRNDAKSQRELYDLYKSFVMGLCRRYTGSRQEAEDVFQETFISVFSAIQHLRESDHLEGWIRRIAINTAVKYYHRNKRHRHVDETRTKGFSDNEYEHILSQFSGEQLVSLINQLPEGYRIVFNLFEIEGYSHADIGELLKISEATSRSQLNRAKQTLKNKLKAFGVVKYERYA